METGKGAVTATSGYYVPYDVGKVKHTQAGSYSSLVLDKIRYARRVSDEQRTRFQRKKGVDPDGAALLWDVRSCLGRYTTVNANTDGGRSDQIQCMGNTRVTPIP